MAGVQGIVRPYLTGARGIEPLTAVLETAVIPLN